MNSFSRIKFLIQLSNAWGNLQAALENFRKENGMLSLAQLLKSKTIWFNALSGLVMLYQSHSGVFPASTNEVIGAALPLVNLILKAAFQKQIPLGVSK